MLDGRPHISKLMLK